MKKKKGIQMKSLVCVHHVAYFLFFKTPRMSYHSFGKAMMGLGRENKRKLSSTSEYIYILNFKETSYIKYTKTNHSKGPACSLAFG